MTKRTLFYIKGYKLDNQKIRNKFPREEGEPENYECYWYLPIINNLPETAYKYVGRGVEPNGDLNLVLVLDHSCDESELKDCCRVSRGLS